MRYKTFLLLGLFLIGSIVQSQTSYSNENENTKILKELLKEIEQLKKGQDQLSKEIATLKTAQPNNKSAAPKGGKKNVPVGNSMVLGKTDAPVTIIKWTDFQ
jgi:TolA-binding protein